MPPCLAAIREWQGRAGVEPAATALIGFSQGAVMALESSRDTSPVAGRIVAIAGRFAALPEVAPRDTTLHLIHGKADPVMPYRHTIAAAERLIGLGADATADVLPFVGHAIDEEVVALLIERLKAYIPRRLWEEAMRAAR
jgi:phospholipase/carboxylesterase